MKEKLHFILLPILRVLNNKAKQTNPLHCSGLSDSEDEGKEGRVSTYLPLSLAGAFVTCL